MSKRYSQKIEGRDNIISLPVVNRTDGDIQRTTERYCVGNTREAISILEEAGWNPISAFVQNRRTACGEADTTKHLVEFEHVNGSLINPELGGLSPRIQLINSHDGGCSLSLIVGFQRLVCMNGLMVGAVLESTRFRHTATGMSELEAKLAAVAEQAETLVAQFETLASRTLTIDMRRILAIQALQLRYGQNIVSKMQNDGTINAAVQTMLLPRRPSDEGDSAWAIFNRLQEALVRGPVYKLPGQYRIAAVRNPIRQGKITTEIYEEVLKLAA